MACKFCSLKILYLGSVTILCLGLNILWRSNKHLLAWELTQSPSHQRKPSSLNETDHNYCIPSSVHNDKIDKKSFISCLNSGVKLKYMPNLTRFEDHNCTRAGFSNTALPLTGLISVPGSGNTWTRHIIELTTRKCLLILKCPYSPECIPYSCHYGRPLPQCIQFNSTETLFSISRSRQVVIGIII